jgi:hypothetical protein
MLVGDGIKHVQVYTVVDVPGLDYLGDVHVRDSRLIVLTRADICNPASGKTRTAVFVKL